MAFATDTIIVAVIVAAVAPSVVAIGKARIDAKQQKVQWARDDALEARRIKREDEVARKAQEVANVNEKRLRSIEDTSKVIHALVNTDLTQAYQRDLASLMDSRDSLQKVIKITIDHGGDIDPHDREELALKDLRISQLKTLITARLAHQDVIDTQSAEALAVEKIVEEKT